MFRDLNIDKQVLDKWIQSLARGTMGGSRLSFSLFLLFSVGWFILVRMAETTTKMIKKEVCLIMVKEGREEGDAMY